MVSARLAAGADDGVSLDGATVKFRSFLTFRNSLSIFRNCFYIRRSLENVSQPGGDLDIGFARRLRQSAGHLYLVA